MKTKPVLPLVTALAGAAAGYLAAVNLHSPGTQPASPRLPAAHAPAKTPKGKAPASGVRPATESVKEKFTRLAAAVPPLEALAAAAAGPDRAAAVRALLIAWINASPMSATDKEWLISEAEATEGRPDAMASLAAILRREELAAYRAPFMQAFRDSPLRSTMFPWLTSADPANNPDKLKELCRDWMPWEQRDFLRMAGNLWARNHPALALEWTGKHQDAAGGNESMIVAAIAGLTVNDPDKAREILAKSTSAMERIAAARQLASHMALGGTREAVEWANALPDGPEKDAAHEAIYNAVPRGVGAVLARTDDELPVAKTVLPDGPLARAGFQNGDVLAGIEPAPGQWKSFAGNGLEDVAEQLRGEPGSTVTIVAMRRNPSTGEWQEYRAPVTREQLVFSQQDSPGAPPGSPAAAPVKKNGVRPSNPAPSPGPGTSTQP